jgi:hypothetical protein
MIFLLFFLLISQQTICMDVIYQYEDIDNLRYGIIYEQFALQAILKLKPEERRAIEFKNYENDTETAHEIWRSFAHYIVQLAQEKKSYPMDQEDIKQFEEYVITLRKASFGLEPIIKVIDETTAIAYATGLLSNSKKESLQKEEFGLSQDDSSSILNNLGKKTFQALENRNLCDSSENEYVSKFAQKRLENLRHRYVKSVTVKNNVVIFDFGNTPDLCNHFRYMRTKN